MTDEPTVPESAPRDAAPLLAGLKYIAEELYPHWTGGAGDAARNALTAYGFRMSGGVWVDTARAPRPVPETMAHSPLPWTVEVGSDGVPAANGLHTEIRSATGTLVARTDSQSLSGRRSAQWNAEDDAAFIVRAVNAYEPPAPPAEPVEEAQRCKCGHLDTRHHVSDVPGVGLLGRCDECEAWHEFAPVEVEDEGSRPLDELWKAYEKLNLSYPSWTSDAYVGEWQEAKQKARSAIEAATRKDATAQLQVQLEQSQMFDAQMTRLAKRERIRADAAEGERDEYKRQLERTLHSYLSVVGHIPTDLDRAVLTDMALSVIPNIEERLRALTAESVTPTGEPQ